MLETQLKTLIKSVDLTNELLLKIIDRNAVGGPRIPQTPAEAEQVHHASGVPYDPAAAETPAPAAEQPQAPAVPNVSAPAPTTQPAAPATPTAPIPAEPAAPAAPSKGSIALQERVMHLSQKTNNPMLGMTILARYKVNAFSELTPNQLNDADAYVTQLAVEAG